MRIVSQDNRFEIPYEDMCIEIGSLENEKAEIIAYPVNGDNSYCWTLGIYNSKERALEVIERIRSIYGLSENYKLLNSKERDFVVKKLLEFKADTPALEYFQYYQMPNE